MQKSPSVPRVLDLIGFGSQGSAWAQCLRSSDWRVRVWLPQHSATFENARELGFEPRLLNEFQTVATAEKSDAPILVAALTPDHLIGRLYEEVISSVARPLTLVIAHGYTVYADDLKLARAEHEVALLAPKAIGPKLLSAYHAFRPHTLVAGLSVSPSREAALLELAHGLGFRTDHLVRTTFEKEAVGDLISEQGLLCGGVLTLLEWTMNAMANAGCPDALIREECLTELELIAGMLRERGPASTFKKISQAAQCGVVAMQERLESSNAKAAFDEQVQDVVSKRFLATMRGEEWKVKAAALVGRLSKWEARLGKPGAKENS